MAISKHRLVSANDQGDLIDALKKDLGFKAVNTPSAGIALGLVADENGDIWTGGLDGNRKVFGAPNITSIEADAEHGAGAIGTFAAPVTSRRTENGTIITEIKVGLTGLGCKGDSQGDAIGLVAGGAAYVGRNVVATNGVVYRIEMICVETPAGSGSSTLDIDLMGDGTGTIAYEGDCDDTVIAKGGNWAAGQVAITNVPALPDDNYLYLGEGAAGAGVYTAGQFIIRLYGHPLLTA